MAGGKAVDAAVACALARPAPSREAHSSSANKRFRDKITREANEVGPGTCTGISLTPWLREHRELFGWNQTWRKVSADYKSTANWWRTRLNILFSRTSVRSTWATAVVSFSH